MRFVVVGMVHRKRPVTGSTSVVRSDNLAIAPTPTAGQALAGKAAGIMTRMADARPVIHRPCRSGIWVCPSM
jgi:hypothetical protein